MGTYPPYKIKLSKNHILTNEYKEFKNNKTIVLAGGIINMGVFGIDVSDVWFHCARCCKKSGNNYKARLSYGDKYCKNCGTKLDWINIKQYKE